MNRRAQHDIARKLKVLNYAKEIGNIAKTCRYFGICRESFYKWRRAYESHGESGLIDSRPCPENHKLRIPKDIEEKIIHLRTTYHFGPHMIVWHLERYHDIKISPNGVYRVLVRNKLNRLPENIKKRSRNQFKRYEKKYQVIMYKLTLSSYFLITNKENVSSVINIRPLMIVRASERLRSIPSTHKLAQLIF